MAAAEAGADAVGFVFYEKSPRHVEIETAAEIIRGLPSGIMKVGVFANAAPEFVFRAMEKCGLNLLQFHGDEPPEYCLQFGLMSMKAFRVRDAESLKGIVSYKTDAWLLDAYSPERLGGSGERFNWDLAIEARKWGKPVFLAGGLTPENVPEAIRRVEPFGVDVSSGVEERPGKKDHEKVRAFVREAKGPESSSLQPPSSREAPSSKFEDRP